MSKFLYSIGLFFYRIGIGIASLFNAKAAKWISGRRNWKNRLKSSLPEGGNRIWVHCASLGEFEQARPLIEEIRKDYPIAKIFLSFFSPSGFDNRHNYSEVDSVFYLPLDGKRNADALLDLLRPQLAIFVKYEIWGYYLEGLRKRGIPTLLVSAAFRQGQVYFKWWGRFFRSMLDAFTIIFVQEEGSASLLRKIGFAGEIILSGDTRYDRVAAIASKTRIPDIITGFTSGRPVLIAGSSWPEDEELLFECLASLPSGWKLILAPHEIDASHLNRILQLFGEEAILYSQLLLPDPAAHAKSILILDNIGMLAGLYRSADSAYVGGGFRRGGIHNVLEPAVFGLPVLFGPVYQKFGEAVRLVELGFAFPVRQSRDAGQIIRKLAAEGPYRESLRENIARYVMENTGATGRIMKVVRANDWLGNGLR
jgi:3-deoxy-D-manno-octulosonic-acid transferase